MVVEVRGEEVAEGIYRIHTWNFTVPEKPKGFVVEDAPVSGDDGWEGPVFYDEENGEFLAEEELKLADTGEKEGEETKHGE